MLWVQASLPLLHSPIKVCMCRLDLPCSYSLSFTVRDGRLNLLCNFLSPSLLEMDPYAGPSRTADQVESSAKAAGLTNTRGPIQLLHFGPQLNSDDIKLLELPHEVLTAVSGGQK